MNENATKEDPGLPTSSRDAAEPGTSSATPSTTQLGVYQLQGRLGQGGMGTVWKAWHTRLKRTVALKTLRAECMDNAPAVARFQREMEAVGKLDHPNLIRATDAGEAVGIHFLVMDFVEGVDAGRLVQQHGPLPIADACELVRQAALGLQFAHEAGLVHRDVKPSNLLVTRQGQVKVLDLGLALLHAAPDETGELTGSNQWMGTADFMAPEQGISAHTVDIRADVYSLGCTLYKLLAGRAPFVGPEYTTPYKKMEAHARQPVPPLRDRRPEVPANLVAVLDRMLAKDPGDRFATPGAVAAALAPFAAGCDLPRLVSREAPAVADPGVETRLFGPATSAPPQDSPQPATVHNSTTQSRRLWWPAALLASIASVALVAGLLAWRLQHTPVITAPVLTAPATREWAPGEWHNVLDRAPEPLFWPSGEDLPPWDAKQERLLVRCPSPGYLRLGTVPLGVRYLLQVGFKDLQWTGGPRWTGRIGLFFGWHEDSGEVVFQQILLNPPPLGKRQFFLCRSMGRIRVMPNGQKEPVEVDLLGTDLPPLGSHEHILEIDVGKVGPLNSVRWDSGELFSLKQLHGRDAPSPQAYHGDFGIAIDKSSARLTKARILILGKE
jgi:serine/threonine protein kinase